MIDDRELLVALFNALGALAKRVTGDTMLLCMKDDQGSWFHFYPNDSHVTWFNQVEVEGRTDSQREPDATHCPLHVSPCASLSEVHQAAEPSAKTQQTER